MSSRVPKYVSSFLIGSIVGAGLALLFTPLTGRKMQKRVGDLADKVVDRVDDLKVAARRMAS
jgi:gas vesicle protein